MLSPDLRRSERLLDLDDAVRARAAIGEHVVRTPLLTLRGTTSGPPVHLKCEALQHTGSFKFRGALHAVGSLDPAARERGVVAHSSGNHAAAVARAARLAGTHATVVVPSAIPEAKLRRAIEDGATIVRVGPASDEREARALELATEDGLTLIPSAGAPAVIAGQGTVALELAEQLEELRPRVGGGPVAVLAPIGGGGLAAGVSMVLKGLDPRFRVFGVEPELAADARESLAAGHLVSWPAERATRTIADGLRLAHVSPLAFEHLRQHLDGIVVVSDREIQAAMGTAAWHGKLVVEPSGAATLAAALFHARELPEVGAIVCILSGGNVDPSVFTTAVGLPPL